MAKPDKKATSTAAPVTATAKLLAGPLTIVNVGLEGFATELAAQKVKVVHVQWAPPAGGDAQLAALLAKLGT